MKRLAAVAAVLAVSALFAVAKEMEKKDAAAPTKTEAGVAKDEMKTFLPEAGEWKAGPEALPPGLKVLPLEGDSSKEGYFATRFKAGDGYKVPPHTHPKHERLTVISGTFYLGMGEKFDESALKAYPAGSYITMPPGMKHFAMFKGEAVVQMTSVGPWAITYVNPADDPRNKKTQAH